MTLEQISLMGLGLGFSVLGWFAREMWSAVQTLKTQLNELEVRISTDYVRYDRLQDALRPVLTKLDQITDVLAKKVDK